MTLNVSHLHIRATHKHDYFLSNLNHYIKEILLPDQTEKYLDAMLLWQLI